MKKNLFLVAAGLLFFASCSKDMDLYVAHEPDAQDLIKTNVEKIFGNIDPTHDWCNTDYGQVNIQVDASVKKVQVLSRVQELLGDYSYEVTTDGLRLLNSAEPNGRTNFTLYYNVAKENQGIYVAFTTTDGYYVRKVENGSVSFSKSANARALRRESAALTTEYNVTMPAGFESYGSERGYFQDAQGNKITELLYPVESLNAGTSLSFSDDFKTTFESYKLLFPNGRNEDNYPKVIKSGFYNGDYYCEQKDPAKPVVVTPLYKADSGSKWGSEVYNSELYYYYFKEIPAGVNAEEYLASLPKYKALSFSDCFTNDEEGVLASYGSYILLYYGDGVPAAGETQGQIAFPEGTKIGFLIRANTNHDKGRKKGEVYGDGRLNNGINGDGNYNFSTPRFERDAPRACWMKVEGRMILSWESGTDKDFNDVMVDVDGIKPFNPPYDPYPEYFTFCCEDRQVGDYDLNDVVIRITRDSETKATFSIIACGAHDELYIKNLPCFQNREVHDFFGKTPATFINTELNAPHYAPYSEEVTVTAEFNVMTDVWPVIENRTQGYDVKLSEPGEDPHAILIAGIMYYPLEMVCITEAFPDFLNWAHDKETYKNWYKNYYNSKVYE